ncbi:MAG: hypothetical protein FJZ95_10685 [Chloroflexi bacterium]|nr:hypothetical protein [Chloroflexota bacterium]
MDGKAWIKWVRRVIRWALLIVTLVYLVTGFGITEFRTVESLTFGHLDKVRAFRIHTHLEIPFITLLALHVLLSPTLKAYARITKR